MAYIAFRNEINSFIEVQYVGKITTPEVERALAERAHLARKYDIKDHLIDLSATEDVPSVLDLYMIADEICDILDYPIRKVAMVLPPSEEIGIAMLYFVMKASHHGIGIKMFTNRQAAIDQLSGTDPWTLPRYVNPLATRR